MRKRHRDLTERSPNVLGNRFTGERRHKAALGNWWKTARGNNQESSIALFAAVRSTVGKPTPNQRLRCRRCHRLRNPLKPTLAPADSLWLGKAQKSAWHLRSIHVKHLYDFQKVAPLRLLLSRSPHGHTP